MYGRFHEAKYNIGKVMAGLKYVEQLLNLTRQTLGHAK